MKTSKITPDQVKKIAKLANLPIDDDKLPKYSQELGNILDLVSKLQKLDTEKIEPTSQVTGLTNVFREDVVKPSLTQEQALQNAPRKHNGYFVTNAVFDETSP